MDEFADIYYVDGNRNAVVKRPAVFRGPPGSSSMSLPSSMPISRSVFIPPSSSGPLVGAMQPAPIAQVAPVVYNTPPPVIYQQPPQAASVVSSLLSRVTAGQLIDMVAQVFAVLQTLPAAPTAVDDTNTNVSNLILYQGALAQHAKRDEQVRTLGSLVSRLVG